MTGRREGGSFEEALAWYDALPAVPLASMMGAWRGAGVPTGNPLDGLLERYGWHGKRFDGIDDVHPLVFDDGHGGQFCVDPARIPLGIALAQPRLARSAMAARAFAALRPALRTGRPAARLRMAEYRAVVTATLCYDALPIHDAFRRIDERTLLGAMDLRGLAQPFFFTLVRECGRRRRPDPGAEHHLSPHRVAWSRFTVGSFAKG